MVNKQKLDEIEKIDNIDIILLNNKWFNKQLKEIGEINHEKHNLVSNC